MKMQIHTVILIAIALLGMNMLINNHAYGQAMAASGSAGVTPYTNPNGSSITSTGSPLGNQPGEPPQQAGTTPNPATGSVNGTATANPGTASTINGNPSISETPNVNGEINPNPAATGTTLSGAPSITSAPSVSGTVTGAPAGGNTVGGTEGLAAGVAASAAHGGAAGKR